MFELITTVGKKRDAEKIASELVKNKLAACVSFLPVVSVYNWKGKIRSEKEWRVEVKTSKSCVKKAEKLIRELHSYELPVIVIFDVKMNKQVERWVKTCTK